MTRRRGAALWAVGLAVITLWGCAPERRPAATARATPVLRVVGPWDLGGLDPKVAGIFTRMQIIEPLVDADDAGRPLPGLADRWAVSDDGLTWRFRVRSGVTFHDGSVLTAAHAAWVLKRAITAPGALSLAHVHAVSADGDEVVIRLTQPFAAIAGLLANSTTSIMARSAYSADGAAVVAVIGTGPYRMASFDPPLRMELTHFDGWRGPTPAVKAIAYQSVSRIETRTLMAQSRQADLVYGLDAPAARRILADPVNRVVDATMPRTLILNLNAGLPGLNDIRVRRALSLALDREGIAAGVLRDPDLAATQLFAPGLPGWHSPTVTPLTYNPAAARALLASAGWTPGPDGVAVKAGKRLAFRLITYPDRAELPIVAAVVQENFRQIGVGLDIVVGNSSEIPLSHRDGSLQMALSGRNYASVTVPLPTVLQDFGRRGGDWGATHWSSPTVISALDQLQRTFDPAKEAPLRQALARGLQDGLPVIPITWYRERVAVSDRIAGGVSFDPLERTFRISQITWRLSANGDRP